MEAKGVAFVSRKKFIISQFGEEKWKTFIEEISVNEPYFKRDILSTEMMPIEKFIYFTDKALSSFYNNDKNVYWSMGEKSAEYSLLEGPYKIYLKSKDIKTLVVDNFPKLWKSFYTDGKLESIIKNNEVDIIISELPVNHEYFEYVIMGYAKKTLELAGANVIKYIQLKSIDKGDKEIHYKFFIEL